MSDNTEHPFTTLEQHAIATLVELIIPASTEYNVPGASDNIILVDILKTAAPHHTALAEALAAFPGDQSEAAIEDFRRTHAGPIGLLVSLTTQCYYRDDRVMRSLDMEARPPFPEGFEVEQGDWSLLDPVRARDPFYRKV